MSEKSTLQKTIELRIRKGCEANGYSDEEIDKFISLNPKYYICNEHPHITGISIEENPINLICPICNKLLNRFVLEISMGFEPEGVKQE